MAGAALFFVTMIHGVQAQPLTRIDNPASLTAALTTAKPGTVFDLAGGEYGPLTLTGLKGTTAAPITLRSADPAHPARFSRMQLRGVSHVTLQGLTFDYRFDPGDKSHLRPFQITSAQGITLTGNLFDGDTARGVSAEDDGFPTAFGLSLRQTSQVRLDGNVIRNFYRGLVVSDSTDLTVRHNDVHDIRADGMDFAQVDRVLIEGNHIHDFRRVVASADHADMIQFWTRGTTRPSTDITIRGNILNSGTGMYTQSIFMRNDLVDTGKAGRAMFYRRVVIEQNIVINAHMNGIAVGETHNLVIRNNTVVRNAASQGVADNPARWTPQIRVAPTSTQVTVTANVTSTVTGQDAQTGWTVADNYLIQDRSPRQSGYYDQVFVAARSGDPTDLASFAYLKGGPLAGKGIGAALLDKPPINLNGAQVPGLRSSDDRAGVSE
ncbi:MAG: right-handed parallel beta-helix repeat-containing protein [Candidatus Saccharibacteria bacterium]|nr:right-handed parallel beta-helix repeat-containing protein [Pseudorhodobacter sp.]